MRLLLDILSAADPLPAQLARLGARDWQQLAQQATRHELECMLYSRVQSLSLSPPPDVRRLLAEQHAMHSLRNQVLYRELAGILHTLSARDIRVIVLKGAYLASCVYEDVAHRSMGDIDLLVEEARLSDARDALASMGYAWNPHRSGHHLPPMRQPGRTMVEIHWRIDGPSSPFSIDVGNLWQRAVPARIGGADTLRLADTDLLLHLCVHIAYHHGLGTRASSGLTLRHLYDVAEVIDRAEAIDWDGVRQRAHTWRCERYAFVTLALVRRLFGTAVPEAILLKLQPSARDHRIVDVVTNFLSAATQSDDERTVREASRQNRHPSRTSYWPRTLVGAREMPTDNHGLSPAQVRARLWFLPRPARHVLRYVRTAVDMLLRTKRGRAAAADRDIEQWIRSP